MEHGASENPPIDVTLREYYGARPSVAAYVLNSPDEIQGDLFSFVVKRPNATVAEVSKLAQDMMQSYMEMTSSRGLASERQLGTGIKSYLKFGDGWEVVELTTPEARRSFDESLSGPGLGERHALRGSKFTVLGFIDELGLPRTFIEVYRTRGQRPPYYVMRIGYGEHFPRTDDEAFEHIKTFFEREATTKTFYGHVSWAAGYSFKFRFDEWNGYDESGLGGTLRTDDRFDMDTKQWAEEVDIAIADALYKPDEFGLHRNIFGLVPSQLFRAVDVLIHQTKLESFQIEGICKTVATAFAVRDENHAIFEQLSAGAQHEALFTTMPSLGESGIYTALDKYLNSSAGNGSAYAWLERYYEQHQLDMYTEDKEFMARARNDFGSPPYQAHYSGRDAEYARDRKEWDEQKRKLATEWVKTHFPYVLFEGVINAYKEVTNDRVDWSGT